MDRRRVPHRTNPAHDGGPLGTYTGLNPDGEPPYGPFGGSFRPLSAEELRARYPDPGEDLAPASPVRRTGSSKRATSWSETGTRTCETLPKARWFDDFLNGLPWFLRSPPESEGPSQNTRGVGRRWGGAVSRAVSASSRVAEHMEQDMTPASVGRPGFTTRR